MKPMLAGKLTNPSSLTFPLFGSPKLDGFRALVMDSVVMSRNIKPVPNRYTQSLFSRSQLNGLDGELIVGEPNVPTTYRDTVSGVSSIEGKPPVVFYVFDKFDSSLPFHERYNQLIAKTRKMNHPHVQLVPHVEIKNLKQLEIYEHEMLERGYEGAMLRSWHGPYKNGRSTEREGYLLKMKRFEDDEAVVIGFEELEHNHNEATKDALGRTARTSHKANRVAGGVLGSLIVQPLKGPSFNIGSGFTAADREDLWRVRHTLKGKIVKYRYFPMGNKERPRFPTFIGWRSPIDQ